MRGERYLMLARLARSIFSTLTSPLVSFLKRHISNLASLQSVLCSMVTMIMIMTVMTDLMSAAAGSALLRSRHSMITLAPRLQSDQSEVSIEVT